MQQLTGVLFSKNMREFCEEPVPETADGGPPGELPVHDPVPESVESIREEPLDVLEDDVCYPKCWRCH